MRRASTGLSGELEPFDEIRFAKEARTEVVGLFPNLGALLRLVGAVRVEAHDESRVSVERR